MPGIKEEQEISVLGRLCSLELLVLFMGCVSLVYGLVSANWQKAATGAVVVAVAVGLLQISRRWCRTPADKRENGNE